MNVTTEIFTYENDDDGAHHDRCVHKMIIAFYFLDVSMLKLIFIIFKCYKMPTYCTITETRE